MKYVVLIGYDIEGVFDTMDEAVAEMEWRKAIGYKAAYIQTMPADTKEYRQRLKNRGLRDEISQSSSSTQMLVENRRARAEPDARFKIGLAILAVFVAIGVLFWLP